jgi:hypothetical protein
MSDNQASNQSSDPSENRSAGGVFIALGTIAGAVTGAFFGQPSIGFLTGLALGSALALMIWLRER